MGYWVYGLVEWKNAIVVGEIYFHKDKHTNKPFGFTEVALKDIKKGDIEQITKDINSQLTKFRIWKASDFKAPKKWLGIKKASARRIA